MDSELALAIALSLQEEKERQQQAAKVAEWPPLFEVQCCRTSFFSLTALEAKTTPAEEDIKTTTESAPSLPPKRTRHDINVGPSRGRSLAIKPTVGTFGRYHNRMLLHCGLADSAGRVYNFDESGCHVDSDWHESISIPVAAPHLSDEQWDAELDRHHKAELTFKAYRPYKQLQNNCYDYVIRFLNGVKFEGRKNHQKEDIVTRFIQAPIDLFEGYFSVRQKLDSREAQQQGYIKLDSLVQGGPRHTCDGCGQLISLDDTRHRCTVCKEFDLCSGCKDVEVGQHKRDHPTLAVAERARFTCDGCRNTITTSHHRCLECPDFDLCGECHSTKKGVGSTHTKHHRTLRL
ncbi:zinc finger, zz type domain containing protein [Acanthamoeba castellanii str. Neff]|uniref:Zinc finger, zz type domain containing protein n=1 Tax=Acanthamoeba castellanii (strain ATCC 30010 / Neff) TaxID=1257118 RepID=L8H689_ACACF|nr:zinc finger, zz type domain containing protein [Acanthamoeba castellanii str. Neff]ELR20747.1 zinc finger, zz type domain containing protein [Acanthamoeba castellanii str. Neff]